jgi:hypothetical protein
VDHTTELARTTLSSAPADTAVVRISVLPARRPATAGAVLVATLVTGPAPGTWHSLGRFSLYPADQPGNVLLRLDAVARQALRESGVPPRLVLSLQVPLASVAASVAASAPASAWHVAAEWLPEPGSR